MTIKRQANPYMKLRNKEGAENNYWNISIISFVHLYKTLLQTVKNDPSQ